MPDKLLYQYDEILEMLGGYMYYTKEQVDYVFHEVNKLDPIKTKELLDICLFDAEIINNKYKNLRTSEEYNKKQEIIKDELIDLSCEESKTI
jgi:hypothetical protein